MCLWDAASNSFVFPGTSDVTGSFFLFFCLPFFGDAVHPGICWYYKNGCVSRTTQKTQLFLSNYHKLRNLLL